MATMKMLLLFLVLSITSGKSEYLRHHRGNQPNDQQPTPYTSDTDANNVDNETYDCVCFNKSQIPVSELLSNKAGTNLKRLVVYLYKDPKSNTIQLYAPNKEKQLQFPDLGLEDGDLFKVQFETVSQIFDASSNAIDILKPQHNGVVTKTPLSDMEVDTPENDNPVDTSQENVNATTLEEVNKDALQKLKVYNLGHVKYTGTSNLNQNSKDSVESTLDTDISDINSNDSNDVTPVEELPVGLDQLDKQLNKTLSLSDDEDGSPLLPGPKQGSDLDVNDVFVPTNSMLKNAKSVNRAQQKTINKLAQNSLLQTIPVDDYFMHSKKRKPKVSKLDVTGNEYVTFDLWFEQQMQKIQNTDKSSKRNFDLSSVKNLIEKTLYENGLYVTKDGVLTDSQANALNVTNLKLRPILIGAPVPYNNLLGLNGANRFEVPSNLPYLESILVTLLNPPRILGVIPVRKTFVPRISYRGDLDYGTWKAQKKSTECQSVLCQFQRKVNQERQRASKKQSSVKLALGNGINGLNFSKKDDKNEKMSPAVAGKEPNDDTFQYRVNLKKVLEAFQKTLFNVPKSKNQNTNAQTVKPETGRSGYEIVFEETPEEDEEELVLPGFRIIGGMAATGSGTPVSSKGRAGRLHGHAVKIRQQTKRPNKRCEKCNDNKIQVILKPNGIGLQRI